MSKSTSNQNDRKLEAKFDYLLTEVSKSHGKNEQLYMELDKFLQNKFQSFLMKVSSKIQTKCQAEIQKLQVYTEYNKEFFKEDNADTKKSLSDLTPSKGYEKEFEDSMKKFKNCAENLTFLESDLNSNSKTITDLTTFSNEQCLEECRKDLKKYKHSETEVRKCLDACMRYRKFNMEAYFKIMIEGIEAKEKVLEKL